MYQTRDEKLTSKSTSNLTNNQQTTNKQLTTNKNIKNNKNIYLFNYYKERAKNVIKFADKMNFLNQIQKEQEYKKLTPDEEYELRDYILKNIGG